MMLNWLMPIKNILFKNFQCMSTNQKGFTKRLLKLMEELEKECCYGPTGNKYAATVIPFTNQTTFSIPYTNELKALYGDMPSIDVMAESTPGVYIKFLPQTYPSPPFLAFVGFPLTQIDINFLIGPLNGFIIIR